MSRLGSIGAWAWKKHGTWLRRSRELPNLLERIKAEGKAEAFQEMSKYIDVVRRAREESGNVAPHEELLEAARATIAFFESEPEKMDFMHGPALGIYQRLLAAVDKAEGTK